MLASLSIAGFFGFIKTAIFAVGYISGNSLFLEPLNAEDEKIYLEKLKAGDGEARNILIERNLLMLQRNILIQM